MMISSAKAMAVAALVVTAGLTGCNDTNPKPADYPSSVMSEDSMSESTAAMESEDSMSESPDAMMSEDSVSESPDAMDDDAMDDDAMEKDQ